MREDRVVELLRSGADDIVACEISVTELFARARAILRRLSVGRATAAFPDRLPSPPLRIVSSAGMEAFPHLRRSEFNLLNYFISHSDRLVSQEELIRGVFGGRHADDTSLVRVHVAHLRKGLGLRAEALRTVRGRGYLLDSERWMSASEE